MERDPLEHLKAILDLLGPNMWLCLDQVSFRWFFGHNIDQGVDPEVAIEAARSFAEAQHCMFIFDEQVRIGKFGRAYWRQDA